MIWLRTHIDPSAVDELIPLSSVYWIGEYANQPRYTMILADKTDRKTLPYVVPFPLDEVIAKIQEAAQPALKNGDMVIGAFPFIVVDLRGEVAK